MNECYLLRPPPLPTERCGLLPPLFPPPITRCGRSFLLGETVVDEGFLELRSVETVFRFVDALLRLVVTLLRFSLGRRFAEGRVPRSVLGR